MLRRAAKTGPLFRDFTLSPLAHPERPLGQYTLRPRLDAVLARSLNETARITAEDGQEREQEQEPSRFHLASSDCILRMPWNKAGVSFYAAYAATETATDPSRTEMPRMTWLS